MKSLKFLQKLRWKIQKCKNVRFVDLFVVLEAFFLQNCIYLRKQPYWTTKSFAVDRIQRFNPRNL